MLQQLTDIGSRVREKMRLIFLVEEGLTYVNSPNICHIGHKEKFLLKGSAAARDLKVSGDFQDSCQDDDLMGTTLL